MESIYSILKEITFRNRQFKVRKRGEGFLMEVCLTAIDPKIAEPPERFGRKWYVSKFSTKSEIVQTALKAVLHAIEHDAREQFRYRGEAIFSSQFDVD